MILRRVDFRDPRRPVVPNMQGMATPRLSHDWRVQAEYAVDTSNSDLALNREERSLPERIAAEAMPPVRIATSHWPVAENANVGLAPIQADVQCDCRMRQRANADPLDAGMGNRPDGF